MVSQTRNRRVGVAISSVSSSSVPPNARRDSKWVRVPPRGPRPVECEGFRVEREKGRDPGTREGPANEVSGRDPRRVYGTPLTAGWRHHA